MRIKRWTPKPDIYSYDGAGRLMNIAFAANNEPSWWGAFAKNLFSWKNFTGGWPTFRGKYSSGKEYSVYTLGCPTLRGVRRVGSGPKSRGGGGSAPKLWNPTLAAKNAARMGHPSVGRGKEKT